MSVVANVSDDEDERSLKEFMQEVEPGFDASFSRLSTSLHATFFLYTVGLVSTPSICALAPLRPFLTPSISLNLQEAVSKHLGHLWGGGPYLHMVPRR